MTHRKAGAVRHSPEFKVEAVRIMRERLAAGTSLQRIGDELGISYQLLRSWAREVDAAAPSAAPEDIFPGHGRRRQPASLRKPDKAVRPEPPEQELARLRRENERLRQERDFLKKAAAFFAKESQ